MPDATSIHLNQVTGFVFVSLRKTLLPMVWKFQEWLLYRFFGVSWLLGNRNCVRAFVSFGACFVPRKLQFTSRYIVYVVEWHYQGLSTDSNKTTVSTSAVSGNFVLSKKVTSCAFWSLDVAFPERFHHGLNRELGNPQLPSTFKADCA